MTEERFNQIKAMPGVRDSIILKLEHIRRYLNMGKASVMVGAGFSKNAKKSHSVEVKDWNALAQAFIDRLYTKDEQKNISFKYTSPLRIASQVEATYGRHELEDIIKAAVPDESLTPGALHEQLVGLGWRDIFTTNYDTLIERAAVSTGMKYEVVTTKETLYYQASKRIIKLHGSHPNARPLIITEEDYRRYPQEFPEFVNTVRQALLETVFCLIGFSGEDPNFLEWLGWIRDIMGDRMSPVYMISIQGTPINDAEKALMRSRGISIIQIPEGLGINEFFDFIFEFLKITPTENKWSMKQISMRSIYSFDTEEQQIKSIKTLRKQRESYPGWLFVNEDRREDVNSLIHPQSSYIMTGIDKITDQLLSLQFLYEVDWRMRANFCPMFFYDWYTEALIKHTTKEKLSNDETFEYSSSLAISLYNIYRLKFSVSEAKEIEDSLIKVVGKLDLEELNRFRYEQCLLRLPLLEYSEVYKILEVWNPTIEDYKGVIWKSTILNELGESDSAVSLLISSKQQAQKAMLTKENAVLEESAIGVIDSILNILPSNRMTNKHYNTLKDNNFSFYKCLQSFVNKIRQSIHNNQFRTTAITREHNFNLKDVTNVVSMCGVQKDEELWYASSMFVFWEVYGYPMGFKEYSINTDALNIGLDSVLGSELSPFGYQYLIRCGNSDIVEKRLSRENVCATPRAFIKYIVPELLSKWKRKYANDDDFSLREWRFKRSVLPILSRLTIFSDSTSIAQLIDIYLILLNSGNRRVNSDGLRCAMNSQPLSELKNSIEKCLELKLVDNYNDILFTVPEYTLGEYVASEKAYRIIIDGLNSENKQISNIAYLRCAKHYAAYCRYNEKELNNTIVNWRNKHYGEIVNAIYSFNLVPYGSTDTKECHSLESIISYALHRFEDNKKDYSEELEDPSISKLLEVVTPLNGNLEASQIEFVLKAILNVLRSKEELFRNNIPHRPVMLAYDNSVIFINSINKFIYQCDINDVKIEVLQDLQEVLSAYCSMDYPAFRAVLKINDKTQTWINKSNKRKYIREVLVNGSESIQTDALAYIRHHFNKNIKSIWNYLIDAFQFMEVQDLTEYVPALCDFCISQKLEHDAVNVSQALKLIHSNLCKSSIWCGDEYDIQYHVMKILGYYSYLQGNQFTRLAGRWVEDIDHPDTPNDVKRGYFEGKEIYRIQKGESEPQ